MTDRPPEPPAPGDWIVYGNCTGRPLEYGKLLKRGTGGWTLDAGDGKHGGFVLDNLILKVLLTRGEAYLLTEKLNTLEAEYVEAAKALRPSFEARKKALLNP